MILFIQNLIYNLDGAYKWGGITSDWNHIHYDYYEFNGQYMPPIVHGMRVVHDIKRLLSAQLLNRCEDYLVYERFLRPISYNEPYKIEREQRGGNEYYSVVDKDAHVCIQFCIMAENISVLPDREEEVGIPVSDMIESYREYSDIYAGDPFWLFCDTYLLKVMMRHDFVSDILKNKNIFIAKASQYYSGFSPASQVESIKNVSFNVDIEEIKVQEQESIINLMVGITTNIGKIESSNIFIVRDR